MRILFVTNDKLGQKRAGPAIRCLELAKIVATAHQVTVASAQPGDVEAEGLSFLFDAARRRSDLRATVASSDIVIAQGLVLARFPFLRRSKFLVIDLYDPYLFEYLAHPHPRFPTWGYLRQWHLLNQQLLLGDLFLCANERQWDYWMGRLCALGRLLPQNYGRDHSLRKLAAVVPFGMPAVPPKHGPVPVLKGVVPGIAADDIVMLWAGGIWQWFDPLTVIRAMPAATKANPKLKLVFLGTEDPNRSNRPMPMVDLAQDEARRLGLFDRSVFFLPGWVPYDQRQDYLLEADIGVSAHQDTVETRFAFRTRVLDYLWARLPMLLTSGDYFADLLEKSHLGPTVPPEDVDGWTGAMLGVGSNPQLRAAMKDRLAALAARFTWEKVARPLVDYCADPYHTARSSRFKTGLVSVLSPAFEWFRRAQA